MKLTMGLDTASLDKAIKKLDEYRKTGLQKKIDRTIGDVTDRIITVADRAYSTTYRTTDAKMLSPTVSFTVSRPQKNTWIITAFMLGEGELISVLEFGAGMETDPSHEYASRVPYRVAPGAYSIENAKTWLKYLQGDRRYMREDGSYVFDRTPKRGMWKGMQAGREYLHRMSRRANR